MSDEIKDPATINSGPGSADQSRSESPSETAKREAQGPKSAQPGVPGPAGIASRAGYMVDTVDQDAPIEERAADLSTRAVESTKAGDKMTAEEAQAVGTLTQEAKAAGVLEGAPPVETTGGWVAPSPVEATIAQAQQAMEMYELQKQQTEQAQAAQHSVDPASADDDDDTEDDTEDETKLNGPDAGKPGAVTSPANPNTPIAPTTPSGVNPSGTMPAIPGGPGAVGSTTTTQGSSVSQTTPKP